MTALFTACTLSAALALAYWAWRLRLQAQRWVSGAVMAAAGSLGSSGFYVGIGLISALLFSLAAAVVTGWCAGARRGAVTHVLMWTIVGLLVGIPYPDDGTVCIFDCIESGPETVWGTASIFFGIALILLPLVLVSGLIRHLANRQRQSPISSA